MSNISDAESFSCTTFMPPSIKLIVRLDCLLLDWSVTTCWLSCGSECLLTCTEAIRKRKFNKKRSFTSCAIGETKRGSFDVIHLSKWRYLGSNCEHDGEIIFINNNLIDVGTHLLDIRPLRVVQKRQKIYSVCRDGYERWDKAWTMRT